MQDVGHIFSFGAMVQCYRVPSLSAEYAILTKTDLGKAWGRGNIYETWEGKHWKKGEMVAHKVGVQMSYHTSY